MIISSNHQQKNNAAKFNTRRRVHLPVIRYSKIDLSTRFVHLFHRQYETWLTVSFKVPCLTSGGTVNGLTAAFDDLCQRHQCTRSRMDQGLIFFE